MFSTMGDASLSLLEETSRPLVWNLLLLVLFPIISIVLTVMVSMKSELLNEYLWLYWDSGRASKSNSWLSSKMRRCSTMLYWLLTKYLAKVGLMVPSVSTISSIARYLVTRILSSSVWSWMRSPSAI